MSADRTPNDFGSKLREARERRGVSLREIANATKISFAALDALERNDISKLPGGIFSRAFVRSYAVEVGLHPETTIQEFIDAFPHDSVTVGHPATDQVEDTEATDSHGGITRTVVRLLAVSLPIAALFVYLATAGRWSALYDRASAPTSSSPPVGVPPAASAIPDPPAAPSERVPPAAADPAPRSAPPAPNPIGSTAAAPPPLSEATDVLTISLSVRTPCVVSALVDGRKAIDQVLRPGDRRTIEVRREIVLTVGDASAVVMTLNGAGARPLGKPGDVVTARLTLANFRDYLSPR